MQASQFERSTPGPKYEYVTFSSDLWLDLRAGDAVAGAALIGATASGSCPAARPRARATATARDPGTSRTNGADSSAVGGRSLPAGRLRGPCDAHPPPSRQSG